MLAGAEGVRILLLGWLNAGDDLTELSRAELLESLLGLPLLTLLELLVVVLPNKLISVNSYKVKYIDEI